jgi:short-subunit dehydrogenase
MSPSITDWTNRRVWLVGASSGLGAELAVQLAAAGAHVILTARTGRALIPVAQRCRAAGGEATIAIADVTSSSQLVRVAKSTAKLVGGIDFLIYLAATYQPAGIAEVASDPDAAADIIDTNLTGALRALAALWPLWEEAPPVRQRGVVLVASVAGYRGLPQALAYGASKAALIHLAESLAIELTGRQIGVWVVNPGFIRTRLTEKNSFVMPAIMTPEAAAEAMVVGLSKGRFEIHFPRRFSYFLKGLQWLPDRLYFFLMKRLIPAKEASP